MYLKCSKIMNDDIEMNELRRLHCFENRLTELSKFVACAAFNRNLVHFIY